MLTDPRLVYWLVCTAGLLGLIVLTTDQPMLPAAYLLVGSVITATTWKVR